MKTFIVSDTHFGHSNICKFVDNNGQKLRPWDDPIKMTEDMIEYWNEVVGPKDKVYHLGDVVINRRFLTVLDSLNGEKVLIKGNHDIFKPNEYLQYFKDIRAYHILDNFLLSHIPIHPMSLYRWKGNIHGHLHSNSIDDPRYFNVSVEKTNFRPINFEDIRKEYGKRSQQNN